MLATVIKITTEQIPVGVLHPVPALTQFSGRIGAQCMAVVGEELGLLPHPTPSEIGQQLRGSEARHWDCCLSLLFNNGISKFDYLILSRLQQSRNLGYNLRVGVSGALGTYSPRRA